MTFELLWIVCIYALGAITVHAAHFRRMCADSGTKHYVLYTLNDGRHIEWVVRSLIFFYWLRGRQVLITVIDEGSTDETMNIVQTLARSHALYVHPQRIGDGSTAGFPSKISTTSVTTTSVATNYPEIIHIRLRTSEDLQKLPISYSHH